MDRAQQVIADRSFGERQQERFVHGIRRALRGGIEPAYGFYLVAEEFDAHRALGLGRIDVEDAASQSVLPRHLDDIGGRVTHGVQMSQKMVDVKRFAAAQNASQVGVVLGRTLEDGGRGNRRNDDRCLPGGNLPEGSRSLFLEFGMRRKILEWKHVAGRKGDDRLGITGARKFAEAPKHRDELLDGTVVIHYDDERPVGATP